ncbi:MAG: T9SS type A sorting domain-containing protein [Bacteroidales bacterium]
MKFLKSTLFFMFTILCFISLTVKAQVVWDFENGEDHDFILRCIIDATPATDNADIAGDEAITGVGGVYGLPDAGIAWAIGPPNQFDGQSPAFSEGCHDDGPDGKLLYSACNDPFGFVASQVNSRGQSSYLNTYNLNQWGDRLHIQDNDQIATSPILELSADAMLYVWSLGGGLATSTIAPVLDADPDSGYVNGSSGIAVLSADDGSLLASVHTSNRNVFSSDTIDLTAFAGQKVIIEVVDAFAGSWGWLAVDEIEITNATISVSGIEDKTGDAPMASALMQNYPNPFNARTTIEYSLPAATMTEIVVYDLLGHKVANLVDGYRNAGTHKIVYDASGLSNGVYIYQLKTDEFVVTKKMKLIK